MPGVQLKDKHNFFQAVIIMSDLFTFSNVGFAYPGTSAVFSQVSFSIQSGAFVLLKGESGAGKSTMLRLFNGLCLPTLGTISYKGKPLTHYPPPALRSRITMVPQTPVVTADTIRANLLLPFSYTGWKSRPGLAPPTDAELRTWLDSFRLNTLSLDQQAQALSIGQKQRLCCIRAMLLHPEVLLMDEPTSALDDASRTIVEQAALDAQKQNSTTVIYISHQDFTTCSTIPCGATITMTNGTAICTHT